MSAREFRGSFSNAFPSDLLASIGSVRSEVEMENAVTEYEDNMNIL